MSVKYTSELAFPLGHKTWLCLGWRLLCFTAWFHKRALLLPILTILSIAHFLLSETSWRLFQSLCSLSLTAWMPAGSWARGFTTLSCVTPCAFSEVILNVNGLQWRIPKANVGKMSTHQKSCMFGPSFHLFISVRQPACVCCPVRTRSSGTEAGWAFCLKLYRELLEQTSEKAEMKGRRIRNRGDSAKIPAPQTFFYGEQH